MQVKDKAITSRPARDRRRIALTGGALTLLVLLLALAVRRGGADDRLAQAVFQGDASGIRSALAAGGDPNLRVTAQVGLQPSRNLWEQATWFLRSKPQPPADGRPLLLASLRGPVASVEALLAGGADPNQSDTHQVAPLHRAACNSVPVARLLLQHGAKVNQADATGMMPLHFAAQYGNVEAIGLLLEKGAERDAKTLHGETPLAIAIEHNQLDGVRALLGMGADLRSIQMPHSSLLEWAAQNGSADFVRLLWKLGIETHPTDQVAFAALSLAIQSGDEETVKTLLDHGISPNKVVSAPASRPPDKPLGSQQNGVIAVFGPLPPRVEWGIPPLCTAIRRGNEPLVQLLLTYRADIRGKGRNGTTPLASAVLTQNVRMVQLCLQHGAQIQDLNTPLSPLHSLAFSANNTALLTLLLKQGADANQRDANGMTPLMSVNSLEAAKVLLAHGADVNAKDNQGRTALHHAVRHASTDIIQVLVQHGAKLDAHDNAGLTPIQVASQNRYPNAVSFLSKAVGSRQ